MEKTKTQVIIFDFSRVLLHPKDPSIPSLNNLYRKLLQQKKFNFFDYYELNHELLAFLQEFKKKHPLYILTSDMIQNAPEIQQNIKDIFTTIFSAKDFGFSKKDPQLYKILAQKLQINPQEITFIDDTQENIDAAAQAGMQTIHFMTNHHLLSTLQTL